MKRALRFQSLILPLAAMGFTGCAFNFEITSQRTALENQVLGSYQELDDDLVLVSSVRSLDAAGKKKDAPELSDAQREAVRAKQEEDFNRDDLDEFKSRQILGEARDGSVEFLPRGIGMQAAAADVAFARSLVEQENHDRQVIWRRIVQMNENLSEKDLPQVRQTFAKLQRDSAAPGTWLQDPGGHWYQKPKA